MKKYSTLLVTAIIACLFLAACSSTKLVSQWKQPGKQINIDKLHKVLVIALFNNQTNRKKAEDQMCAYLDGKGVPSYDYLNLDFNKKNNKAWQKQIKADGFDGAITMRLVDMDKDTVYRPGTFASSYPDYYRNFDGYYSRNYELYNTPDLFATTKTYTVEINVYSIKEDNIIWSGITKSVGPDGIEKMTAEISKAVFKKMKKEGFLVKE